VEHHILLNPEAVDKLLKLGLGVPPAHENHHELWHCRDNGREGIHEELQVLFQDMLTYIQTYRYAFGDAEMLDAFFPERLDIRGRLHVYAVFHNLIGTSISIIAKRFGRGLLGNPDVVRRIVKGHDPLDLIVHDRLDGKNPLKIIFVFGMEGSDEGNPSFLGLPPRELACGKRGMSVDDLEAAVLQFVLKQRIDVRNANPVGRPKNRRYGKIPDDPRLIAVPLLGHKRSDDGGGPKDPVEPKRVVFNRYGYAIHDGKVAIAKKSCSYNHYEKRYLSARRKSMK